MLKGVALTTLGYMLGSRAARVAIGRSEKGASADRPGASSGAASPSSMLKLSAPIRGGSASSGTSIWATVEARLLGLPLLALDADVAMVPAEVDVRGEPEFERNASAQVGLHAPAPNNGVSDGGRGLVDAAKAIEASSDSLRKAREQMP